MPKFSAVAAASIPGTLNESLEPWLTHMEPSLATEGSTSPMKSIVHAISPTTLISMPTSPINYSSAIRLKVRPSDMEEAPASPSIIVLTQEDIHPSLQGNTLPSSPQIDEVAPSSLSPLHNETITKIQAILTTTIDDKPDRRDPRTASKRRRPPLRLHSKENKQKDLPIESTNNDNTPAFQSIPLGTPNANNGRKSINPTPLAENDFQLSMGTADLRILRESHALNS